MVTLALISSVGSWVFSCVVYGTHQETDKDFFFLFDFVSKAFYEVGGYPKLVSKYMEAIPSKTQQGNWTAQPECYLPRQDAFHIFRSCVSGDIPWPGLILGATTVSLFYGCADQVIKCMGTVVTVL